jgi:hypothetical protein
VRLYKRLKVDESILGVLGSGAAMGLGYGLTKGLINQMSGKKDTSDGDAGGISALGGGGFSAGIGSGLTKHLLKPKSNPKKQRKI